jgi:uncharacterized protein (DUF1800 family)
VVHLHRRAGFAATWSEIDRDLREGPAASVTRLLEGKSRAAGAPEPEEFERLSTVLGDAAIASSDAGRLKAWWFYRLLFSSDPLGERLTLMWHNHFATSNQKVNDPAAMRRQNDLFRRLARAPFGTLLERAVHDPALLVWLDAPANRKGHPNENLAREFLELFSLGIGRYSESDVRETARALTGWNVVDGESRDAPSRHDDGTKTILGQTGKWRSSDVVRIILEHPGTAERLAWRICDLLMGEGMTKPAITALADGLRKHQLDVGWAVGTVLRSRAFFAESNLGTRVQSPVEFIVAAVRALELLDPPPSTLVLADWAARMVEDLFDPPNVGGWPGGRTWISSRVLIARSNYVAALIEGPNAGRVEAYDPTSAAKIAGFGTGRADLLAYHNLLLFGSNPTAELTSRLGKLEGRKLVTALLSSPEAQLG